MADFLDTADELRKTIDLGDDKASFDAVFKGISALQAVHSKSTLDVYNLESVFAAFEMASLFGRLGSLTAEEIRGMSSAIRRLIVRTLEERIMLPVRGKTVNSAFAVRGICEARTRIATFAPNRWTRQCINRDVQL